MKKRTKIFFQNLFLATLSAFMIYLIIAYQLRFLIWIAFIPIFYGIRESNFKRLTLLTLIYVSLINISSLNWFYKYSPSVLYTSIAIMFLFGLFLIRITGKFSTNKFMKIFSFPLIWIILLFLFSFSPLGSIFVNFAFFYSQMTPLIWYIGSIGITFLIISFNSLAADYLLTKNKKVLITILIIITIILFCNNYSNQEYITNNSVKIALIQGNINQSWFWRIENTETIIQTYKSLSLEAAKKNPEFIIWPEYAVPQDIFLNQTIYNKIRDIAIETNSYLIFGAPIYPNNQTNTLIQEKYDSLIVFSPSGELIARYDSKNPLPFDKTALRGKKENSNNLLHINGYKIRTGLCFEELKVKNFHGESDFIIGSVNNQFFDHTSGLDLVSQFSKLIAAENKKYFVRTSNTGITQIVNPYGKVIHKLSPHEPGILIENIYI